MLIRMLVAERVAANGRDVRWRKEGEILDLPDSLAESMIRSGTASASLLAEEENPLAHQPKAEIAHQPKAQVKPTKKREYR
jgi:hypothetical protein